MRIEKHNAGLNRIRSAIRRRIQERLDAGDTMDAIHRNVDGMIWIEICFDGCPLYGVSTIEFALWFPGQSYRMGEDD